MRTGKESVYDYVEYGNEDLFMENYVSDHIDEFAAEAAQCPLLIANEIVADRADMFSDLLFCDKESIISMRDAILADLGREEVFNCIQNIYRANVAVIFSATDRDTVFITISELIKKAAYNVAEKDLSAEADDMLESLND